MNYLETGLPHTDLYRKKSEFVPPRYKPLCSLGRRYLGLEPPSKTEMNSFINRLSQPKKQPTPEPEPPPKSSRVNRTSGSVRFSGRKRMTGNQIGKMVDRLTKRRTEVKDDEVDIKKKETKNAYVAYRTDAYKADNNENKQKESLKVSKERIKDSSKDTLVSTRTVSDETHSSNKQSNREPDAEPKPNDVTMKEHDDNSENKESIAQFKEIEKKMLQYLRAKEEKERAEKEARSLNPDQYDTSPLTIGSAQVEADKKSRRTSEEDDEEKRYESLYYRGVKTEIARKFFAENYKRPSIQINKVNKSESGTKSTKTSESGTKSTKTSESSTKSTKTSESSTKSTKTSESGTKSTKTILVFSPRRHSRLEDIQNRKPRFRSKTT